ncbi:alpha-ketoglutarate-dependent dioxygenase AlkB [Glutamicibacter sp. BW77]|uniref:alpha-ketoglutarate-dependent dioxygenase AlkB family protein n=1 Tax=Glutamicibacter sp. BW77 TaxID=2024402 RepID=UPI000BB7A30A|nr:alpha-ketoglutarate-dependent dioxygenase AlkB [Glutamicibacter sp. BW77]PCC36493.1 alpha-ketoglutarate-dependent dioxygenase AlkB [Glutamicibacter sp. BW77]
MQSLFDDGAFGREPQTLRPGAVHVPGWLTAEQQDWITEQFLSWGQGPVPPHSTLVNGHPMKVKTVCLGWHWGNYQYTRTAEDLNGAPVPPMPDWLVELGRRAVAETTTDPPNAQAYNPDVAIINYYPPGSTMGMHQDAQEKVNAPIVSLSIGDSANFRLGNNETRTKPYQDVRLASGDLFVFEGPARWVFHAVTKIYPGTGPAHWKLGGGRINITLRETGMS